MDVNSMSVAELKAVITKGGLTFVGLTEKQELKERAAEAIKRIESGDVPAAVTPEAKQAEEKADAARAKADGMSVAELRKAIAEAGMTAVGLTEKHELKARAAEALVYIANRPVSFFEKPLGEYLVTKDGKKRTSDVLNGKEFVLLYMSAHWCPPCRRFTPNLARFYCNYARDLKFEVVFLSSDKDEDAFDEYYEEMPWAAVPFDTAHRTLASREYGAEGIPELVVLHKSGAIIRRGAVQNVYSDPQGQQFPWK